jgi:hypothetical protein
LKKPKQEQRELDEDDIKFREKQRAEAAAMKALVDKAKGGGVLASGGTYFLLFWNLWLCFFFSFIQLNLLLFFHQESKRAERSKISSFVRTMFFLAFTDVLVSVITPCVFIKFYRKNFE